MMENRALKKLSLEFRDVSSRALRSDEHNARPNLRRLLAFVQQSPILAAEVERAPRPDGDIMELWEAVRERGERLPIPDDPLEELGLLHSALSALAEHQQPLDNLCYMYGRVRGFEESVAEVLHDVAGRYVSHLNRVIEIALLDSNDPAYGPARRIDIRVDGGTNQWNLAQDGSRIDATQHVNHDALAIIQAAEQLVRVVTESHAEGQVGIDQEEVREIAATIIAEMRSGSPKRFTLKAASEKLTQIAAASTAASTIITHAGTLATLLSGWLAALR